MFPSASTESVTFVTLPWGSVVSVILSISLPLASLTVVSDFTVPSVSVFWIVSAFLPSLNSVSRLIVLSPCGVYVTFVPSGVSVIFLTSLPSASL